MSDRWISLIYIVPVFLLFVSCNMRAYYGRILGRTAAIKHMLNSGLITPGAAMDALDWSEQEANKVPVWYRMFRGA